MTHLRLFNSIPFFPSFSLSLRDGGGVCAGGLPVRVPASARRFRFRISVLHAGVSWREEESGPVLLIAWRGAVLGPGHPNSQRPSRQHEPEREARSISFQLCFQFVNARVNGLRGKVSNQWPAGLSVFSSVRSKAKVQPLAVPLLCSQINTGICNMCSEMH